MTTSTGLERRCRRLLRCYPAAWRRRHEDEMVAVLLDQADAAGRSSLTASVALDLVGHGAEERLESMLRWLPDRLRTQIAVVTLTVAAGLALTLLVGEVLGARHRVPTAEIDVHGHYFNSGPFLTIGVGLYLAFMSAALLVVLGHGGPARVLVLLAVASTAWMHWSPSADGYPVPRLLVLALFAGLGLLAALATLRPDRRRSRRMVGFGAGFVTAVAAGLWATKPFLGWSVGTMATSGNVAFAALAVTLPFVGGAAILVAALTSRRHPGWPAAIAVATLPVVVFCTVASQMVNPQHSADRAFFPLYYLVAVASVALVHHRAKRRLPAGAPLTE
ncbi:hypothetical protein [uncultured Friedmanniella sp.]|uniref:hypothetical protein n=1 Tax=uncultured Friedmanniella sp. TaxID=335381 RepID=UPI0035CA3EE6